MLIEEPFNYLDPSSQINIAKIIHQVNQKYGTTVLISSHNLNFISEICSRVVLMEKGKIIKDMNNENQEATHEMEDYFNQ
ncbi:hypothetical protein [Prevotella disiens]